MALARLKKKILGAKTQRSDGLCLSFMPQRCLPEILQLQDVAEALHDPRFHLPLHKCASTASLVVREPCQKIFAILLELNCEEYLSAFIENDCRDSSLPLDSSTLADVIPTSAELFARLQHDYLVYSFCKGHYHRKLRDYQRLPYVSQEKIGGGGFSSVFRVAIHSSHQDFDKSDSSETVSVVRKELRTSQHNGVAEAELLYLLESLKHPNIVELLVSYTQHDIPNLLFAPAEFDLHQLLLMPERPKNFPHNFLFLRALQGLSSGLSYLHNFCLTVEQPGVDHEVFLHGYHHDIKPRNILVRGSDFVLADFGSSRLKEMDEDTKTPWKDTTFEYGPPQCRDPESFTPGMVGRALDIWSLGCIFSEVVAYMEYGSQSVLNFRDARVVEGAYGKMRCFHNGESLSPKVRQFLETTRAQSRSTAIGNLVMLITRTLATDPLDRPNAEAIGSQLYCFAITDLLDLLFTKVDNKLKDGAALVDRNLFQTRLALERNRLLTWGYSLGLKSLKSRTKPYHEQIDILAASFYATLQSAFESWSSKERFPIAAHNQNFNLQILRQTNDKLCEHLSDQTMLSIDDTFHMITMDKSASESLQQLIDPAIVHSQESDVSAVAAMKYMSILLEMQKHGPGESFRIEPSLMRLDTSKSNPAIRPETWLYSYGYQQGEERKTVVEYVPYWKEHPEDSRSPEFQIAVEAMFKRVEELVRMLKHVPKPANFRVLDCLGAFHDSRLRRFALVYTFPLENSLPVRLNNLLRHGKSYLLVPDLQQKFLLAKKLIACVQSCHTSSWIHKSISSLNILFFPDTDNDIDAVQLSEPYLVGWDHSRQDRKGEYTQGPILSSGLQEYLHPEYRKGFLPAERSFDYYSLGLVLLEIGLWMSISNIYDQQRYQTFSPAALRNEYIALCERDLHKVMGPIYQSVTSICLHYGLGTGDLEEQLDFQTQVVDRINTCVL